MARWSGNAGVHTGTAPRSGARRRTSHFREGVRLGTYPTGRTGPRSAIAWLRVAPPGGLGTCKIPELHFPDRRGVQEDPIMDVPVGLGIAARQRSEPHDLYFPYGARSAVSGRIAIGCKRGFLIGIPCRKSFCDNLVFLSREIAFQRQSDNLIGIPRRKSFCDNSAFLSRENVLQRPSHHLVGTPSRSPFSHGTRNRVAIP